MSALAPKSFNQLRFFSTVFVGVVGFYTGNSQKGKNQVAWDEYYAKKFKAQAEKHEAEKAAHAPKSEISSEVPEELHDLVRALGK
jgi:hypothetical protein